MSDSELNLKFKTLNKYATELAFIFRYWSINPVIIKFEAFLGKNGSMKGFKIYAFDNNSHNVVESLRSMEEANQYWEMFKELEKKYKNSQYILNKHIVDKKIYLKEHTLDLTDMESFKKSFLGEEIYSYLEKEHLNQILMRETNSKKDRVKL